MVKLNYSSHALQLRQSYIEISYFLDPPQVQSLASATKLFINLPTMFPQHSHIAMEDLPAPSSTATEICSNLSQSRVAERQYELQEASQPSS